MGLQRAVRRVLLARLKNSPDLNAFVPSASIDPSGVPAWPFIVLRSPTTQRLRATGVRGGRVTWDVHAFAGPRLDGDEQEIETAQDHASAIGELIEATLADTHITLENGGDARIILSDIRLLEDGDTDRYHWFAQINARVLAE